MARNTVTGQTIKTQDLTGGRFTLAQRNLAMDVARKIAEEYSARSRQLWEGYVVEYEPTVRRTQD